MARALHFWTAMLCLACAPASVWAAADNVSVQVGVSNNETYIGEPIQYQVRVMNARNAAVPVLDGIEKDFKVGTPSQSSMTESINFRTTRKVVFTYELTPLRAGNLTIPAPKVAVGGGVVTGQAVQLLVKALEKQDLVVMSIDIEPKKAYPSQKVRVTLRIAMKPLPGGDKREPIDVLSRNPPELEMPWFAGPPEGLSPDYAWRSIVQSMPSHKGEGFELTGIPSQRLSLFSRERYAVCHPPVKRELRKGLDGKEYDYFVYEIALEYIADKPGVHTLGPATLRGQFVTGIKDRHYIGKRFPVVSPPATVQVVDLFTRDAPPQYTGGIGELELSARAAPEKLRVGDPLTLELEVKVKPGGGSLDLIGALDLSTHAELAKDFVIIDSEPVGEVDGDAKRFKYGLRPKRAGVQMPALTMAAFDPVSETFKDYHTQPVALTVVEAATITGSDVVGARPGQRNDGELGTYEGGIRQNLTAHTELGQERADPRMFWAYPFVAWALYGLVAWWVGRSRRLSGDVAYLRRSGALKLAQQRLATAQAPDQVRAALLGLAADLTNQPQASMTPREAGTVLSAAGVGEASRQALDELLNEAEAAAYGGADGDAQALRTRAESLAQQLDGEARA